MTILAYCAGPHFQALAPRRFLYPLGSGTLGYAWPAALGARLALPDTPVLAVAGDGGIHYGLTELASARQHGIAATLLIVDDGRYGILREYQQDAYGETFAVDLVQPDFVAVAEAFGVPARRTAPDDARRRPGLGARAWRARCGRAARPSSNGSRRRRRRHPLGMTDWSRLVSRPWTASSRMTRVRA